MNRGKVFIIGIVVVLLIAVGVYFSHPHNYAQTLINEVTCTEEGTIHYSCWCGKEYAEHPAPLGHDYVSEVTQDATCTDDGIMTYTCSRCNDTYTEEIKAAGHNYVKEVCEKAGYIKEVCTECKEVVEQKDEEFWKNIITMYTLENGDIYKEASTDSAVLGSLKKGDSVTVSKVGEWDELVMDDGTVGYVRGDLLSDTNPSESAPVDTTKGTETSNQTEQSSTSNTGGYSEAQRQALRQKLLDAGATTGGEILQSTGVAHVDDEIGFNTDGVTLH